MDLKLKLGKKIKSIRLEKALTQLEVCGDESHLTIRQLARIENGQAMITLPKLMYLSQIFQVPIQDLIDLDKMVIPNHYLELKQKLIKSHTYGDPDRIQQHEAIFDEIYEKFYDDLPEEEQLLVELLQIRLDIFSSQNPNYAISLLEEYFHQLLKKTYYSYNDLLIINIYFFCCAIGFEDTQYFEELSSKVLSNIDYSDSEKLYLLELILLGILIQVQPEQYLYYTKIFRKIIKETKNFQHKPVVYAFEARYYSMHKDYSTAKKLYNKAITFAEMLEDDILVKNLKREKQHDLSN